MERAIGGIADTIPFRGAALTLSELAQISRDELLSRSLPGKPATAHDLDNWLAVMHRELGGLPAQEVRMAVKEYCATGTCGTCHRPVPWPSPESVRAHVSQTVLDQVAQRRERRSCPQCDDGWRRVVRNGVSAVERCDHGKGAASG